MAITRERVTEILATIPLPGGGDLVSRDMVRALSVEGGTIRFVIEAASVAEARGLGPVQQAAEAALRALPGVIAVQVATTAHEAAPAAAPAERPAAPALRIGGHATAHHGGPQRISGIGRVIAIASGKGGVGKSTVASNLSVALARQGRRVGLLGRARRHRAANLRASRTWTSLNGLPISALPPCIRAQTWSARWHLVDTNTTGIARVAGSTASLRQAW